AASQTRACPEEKGLPAPCGSKLDEFEGHPVRVTNHNELAESIAASLTGALPGPAGPDGGTAKSSPPPWARVRGLTAQHRTLLDCLWAHGRPKGDVPLGEVVAALWGVDPRNTQAVKDKLRALRAQMKRTNEKISGKVPYLVDDDSTNVWLHETVTNK